MVMIKVLMDTSRSSKQNLLEDGTVLPSKQQATSSNFACVLFQAILVFVGLFVLFVAANCLANHVFANDGNNRMLFREMIGLQREEISLLQSLRDAGRDVDDAEFNQFESLIKELNITYNTQDELESRFRIFSNNLKRIELAQKDNENTLFGVSQFTLMSDDELQAFVMPETDFSSLFSESDNVKEPTTPLPTRPPSVDWRTKHAVTRVKDQGKCNSSWAFALTATIEAARVIQGHHPLEERSEQELIDCASDHGCNDINFNTSKKYLEDEGVTVEKLYPYAGKQQTCRKIKDQKAKVLYWAFFINSESKVADWVAAKGPVLTFAHVTHELYAYKSGVFNPSETDCEKHNLGMHLFTIVGYGTENKDDYWLLKNNWGTKFGDHGYIKMKRGVFSCSVAWAALAPIL